MPWSRCGPVNLPERIRLGCLCTVVDEEAIIISESKFDIVGSELDALGINCLGYLRSETSSNVGIFKEGFASYLVCLSLACDQSYCSVDDGLKRR